MGKWKVTVCTIVFFISWIFLANAGSEGNPACLIINLPSRTLEFYRHGILMKEYQVAIGKPSTPTPLGDYSIIEKQVNPWWYPPEHPGYFVTSGPYNPLGYRWMGFAANYGVHGTNAPWSIGLTVSNGCIRMHEEDVEELFELVGYNTPVRVTYDRAKLRVDRKGWVSLALYPDVYGYKEVSLVDVKTMLVGAGLGSWVSDEALRQYINEAGDRQAILGRVYSLKVNDKALTQKAVLWDNILYVPINSIEDALQITVNWDGVAKTLRWKGQTAPGLAKGGILYVSAENIEKLFGGRRLVEQEDACLTMVFPGMIFEGKRVTNEMQKLNGGMVVPALALASALGQRVVWDGQVLKMGMKKIPTGLIEEEPYIRFADLREYFNADVSWDEGTQTANLSYPVHPIDYSMYLELMGDFW